jgi:transcriptional regulator GlxA family with amidase domain
MRQGSPRRPLPVWIVMFPDVQALDVTGPLEVFALANRPSPGRAPRYELSVLAPEAGAVSTSSGLSLLAGRDIRQATGPVDTLLVAGGQGTRAAMRDTRLVSWIRRTAARARRVASVCSGAFLLGEAGLLDGRRATTHWAVCDALQRRYPTARVEADPIFVRDGKVSTSAGVTAGMDLALELVEEDGGRDLALAVARWLVMFLHRPGGQTQFASPVWLPRAERPTVRTVQTLVESAPADDHRVPTLAAAAAMSVRHFTRVFTAEVGETPSRFVERTRVEAARR